MPLKLLRTHFRPEFINRLDETILFRPLTESDMSAIVRLLLKRLEKRLKEQTLTLSVTDSAVDYIVKNGSDAQFGARPLKRFIQANVETLIAKKLLAADPQPYSVITVDVDENGLVVK